jgi:hypothetical protein
MLKDTTSTPESRARLAYTAYGKAVDFRNKDGQLMPAFDKLGPRQRAGWTAAAGLIWSLATTGRATL